jgi:CRISPR-associated protein Cmr2
MGKTLNRLTAIDQHKKFSTALDGFAGNVHQILEKYQGQVIYSGGDDVMAYVPLHQALDCADAVNDSFARAMKKACAGTGINQIPTFSMGMVIVHQHKPLHQVLELAKTAERHAKNEGNRNCLTIIQSKRGGSDLTVYGSWQKKYKLASLIPRIKTFVELYNQDKLSSRLGYQLRGIVRECGKELKWTDKGQQQPDSIAAAEALRVIGRKREKSGQELAPDDAAMLLAGQSDLRAASDELVIAHQISAACKLATGSSFKQIKTKGDKTA